MQRLGMTELILILVIALVIFGPSKLPEIGRSIGQSINEFKKGMNEISNDNSTSSQADKKDSSSTDSVDENNNA